MKTPQNQYNAVTNALYEGNGNQISLQIKAQEKSYKSNKWLTFLQAKSLGLKIKKGARGVRLIHVATQEQLVNDKKFQERVFNHFVVFNLDQTEKVEVA